jgi:hypothetical protein
MTKTLTKTGAAIVALFLALAFAAVAIPAKAHAGIPHVSMDGSSVNLAVVSTTTTSATLSFDIAGQCADGGVNLEYKLNGTEKSTDKISNGLEFQPVEVPDGCAEISPGYYVASPKGQTVGLSYTISGLTPSTTYTVEATSASIYVAVSQAGVYDRFGKYVDFDSVNPTVTFTTAAPDVVLPSEDDAVNAAKNTKTTVEATGDKDVVRVDLDPAKFTPGQEIYITGFSTPTYLGKFTVAGSATAPYVDVNVAALGAGTHTLTFADRDGRVIDAVTLDLKGAGTAAGFGLGGLAVLVALIGAAGVAARRKTTA